VASTLRGWKIRSARLAGGLSQAELARRAGLSAPYLNLIERNRRPASAAILARIADALGVALAELDGEAERRLSEEIGEILVDPVLAASQAAIGSAEDLVGRAPGWAEVIRRLYRAYRDQRQSVLALADRLNHDPFLGEGVHRLLTHVTSIRSSAEILAGQTPLDAAERDRFLAIVTADSARLSDAARSLLSFFEDNSIRVRSATTMEHVDAFIFDTNNYFGSLEMAAAEVRSDLRDPQKSGTPALDDAGGGRDEIAGGASNRSFRSVRRLALPVVEGEIDRIVSTHPALPSAEARELARSALSNYAAAAVLMPYDDFLGAARACRYDLDVLGARYGVSYEQAAHRVATLRKPGAEGVRFAYMRSDPSGFVTKRLPVPGLPLPRYGTACPLWVIYGAFQTPGATVRGFGELPGGEQFLFLARAVEKSPAVVGRPRHLLSIMLACPAAEAAKVVYGDGLDMRSAMIPVGTICRLCTRLECGARQEPPLLA